MTAKQNLDNANQIYELVLENENLKKRNKKHRSEQSAYMATIADLRSQVRELNNTLRKIKPRWEDAPLDAAFLWIQWKWAGKNNVAIDEPGFYSERRPMEEIAE